MAELQQHVSHSHGTTRRTRRRFNLDNWLEGNLLKYIPTVFFQLHCNVIMKTERSNETYLRVRHSMTSVNTNNNQSMTERAEACRHTASLRQSCTIYSDIYRPSPVKPRRLVSNARRNNIANRTSWGVKQWKVKVCEWRADDDANWMYWRGLHSSTTRREVN